MKKSKETQKQKEREKSKHSINFGEITTKI
jgi:hypothetical protein